MRAGKHVLIEIPVTDSVADAEALVKIAKETGVVAMGGHVRRFNPSHQYVHKKIAKGELNVQQMDVQTYFFRRKNMNAAGPARSWTDHLLWHHAAHTDRPVPVSDRRDDFGLLRRRRARCIRRLVSRWIWASSRGCRPARSSRCRCPSTMTDRSARSFATSATTAPIKAYYDDLVDGKDNKIDLSQVDVSMNGSSWKIASSSPPSRKSVSRTPAWRSCCRACTCRQARRIVDPLRKAPAEVLTSVCFWQLGRSIGISIAMNFIEKEAGVAGPFILHKAVIKGLEPWPPGRQLTARSPGGCSIACSKKSVRNLRDITASSAGAVNATVLADGSDRRRARRGGKGSVCHGCGKESQRRRYQDGVRSAARPCSTGYVRKVRAG